MLPLARLGEVVLHHVDLDTGYRVSDIGPQVAGWVLEWAAFRLSQREDFPALRLDGESGLSVRIGPAGAEPRTVSGDNAHLLGWLTGRSATDGVTGADDLTLPPY